MAAPLDPANLDHAIDLYLAGEPEPEIIATTGVSHSALHRERGRRGIPPRRNRDVDSTAIVAAYLAGESEYALARHLGVSRGVVRKRLTDAGVTIRRPSEAGLVRASKMPKAQRATQAAAAQRAARQRKVSEAELCTRARARERDGKFGSEGELFLAQLLERRDLLPIPQKAIGKYNIDMAAAETVAVEVLGGNWHSTKGTHAIRTPQILNAGWHLIMVWNQNGTGPITAGAADYIAAFAEQVRWQPTLTRQYRVVTGDGEVLAARCADDDEFPLIPPSRRAVRRRP